MEYGFDNIRALTIRHEPLTVEQLAANAMKRADGSPKSRSQLQGEIDWRRQNLADAKTALRDFPKAGNITYAGTVTNMEAAIDTSERVIAILETEAARIDVGAETHRQARRDQAANEPKRRELAQRVIDTNQEAQKAHALFAAAMRARYMAELKLGEYLNTDRSRRALAFEASRERADYGFARNWELDPKAAGQFGRRTILTLGINAGSPGGQASLLSRTVDLVNDLIGEIGDAA